MNVDDFADAGLWAQQQWSNVALGDARRNARAVQLGAALAAQPHASLPAQTADWADLKAAYRLLNEADVTHQALSQPHWQQTRLWAEAATEEAATEEAATAVVLFLQDTTELDYTSHRRTQGLGHIGNGGGAGLVLHSCLALCPEPSSSTPSSSTPSSSTPSQPRVLGVAAQKIWTRGSVHRGQETRTERRKRANEADVWAEMVEQIGPAPETFPQTAPSAKPLWVSVGDRGSDIFSFLSGLQTQRWHCLARLSQDRVLLTERGERVRLKHWLRSLPPQAHKSLTLRGRAEQPGRTVDLSVSWAPVILQPPRTEPGALPVAGWCLRGWEEPAVERAEPLEWLLFSTVPVGQPSDALRLLEWYACRWVIEEYHKCLKSGCQVEQRQLREAGGLQALLGFLAIVAVRLLQLRTLSRTAPEAPAQEVVAPLMLRVLAARLRKPPEAMTMGQFWRGLAGLGGFLGRKSDGDPGWQTLWRGWQRLQDMCWGATMVAEDG